MLHSLEYAINCLNEWKSSNATYSAEFCSQTFILLYISFCFCVEMVTLPGFPSLVQIVSLLSSNQIISHSLRSHKDIQPNVPMPTPESLCSYFYLFAIFLAFFFKYVSKSTFQFEQSHSFLFFFNEFCHHFVKYRSYWLKVGFYFSIYHLKCNIFGARNPARHPSCMLNKPLLMKIFCDHSGIEGMGKYPVCFSLAEGDESKHIVSEIILLGSG